MLRSLFASILFFLAGLGAPQCASLMLSQGPISNRPYTPLHVYYISTTGSDSNNGLTSGTAWATPNHSVQCGDVIVVAPGTYSSGQFGTNAWGTVSNCPSSSGGIDGTGGIYFATVLCAGPNMTSCQVNGGAGEAFRVGQSNWAIEGFTATQNQNGNGGCYVGNSEVTRTASSQVLHHIAFINDIASGCDLAGFDTNSWTGNYGSFDQTAVVGTISYNAAQSISGYLCGSAISIIPSNGPDTSSGTHIFVSGNFVYKNSNGAGANQCTVAGGSYPHSDGEGIIFDSWGLTDGVGYKYQAVAEQNLVWMNGGAGFEAFPQDASYANETASIHVFNNTFYSDFQDQLYGGGGGEIYIHNPSITSASTGTYQVTNNIALATLPLDGGGAGFGAAVWCSTACDGPAQMYLNGNYIWNSSGTTTNTTGGTNTSGWYNNAPASGMWTTSWGTNTYNDPGFASAGGLPVTAPNCGAYSNTADCMLNGYRAYAHLTPSGGAVGVGYAPPTGCAPDSYYPSWLKGVVYLKWDSTSNSVFEVGGLLTKPCGL